MAQQKNFLDSDNTQFENNLRFVKNELEDNLQNFFGGAANPDIKAPPRDFKIVVPQPGLCVKSFKVNNNQKFFVNVCQAVEIPPPEDVSEDELAILIQSDEPSSFRIPMSISEPRIARDKSNNPVDVCDIAINPKFFAKIQRSRLFKEFFLTLIGEALSEKYNVQIKIDKAIILSNRKFIGTLVSHRVRNSDVKSVMTSYINGMGDAKAALQKELEKNTQGGGDHKLVKEIDPKELIKFKIQADRKHQQRKKAHYYHRKSSGIDDHMSRLGGDFVEPEFRLRARVCKDVIVEVQAEFHMPKCLTSNDFFLDVGEDRIVIESNRGHYYFDRFLKQNLISERAQAIYDKTSKMLQIRIPVNTKPESQPNDLKKIMNYFQ